MDVLAIRLRPEVCYAVKFTGDNVDEVNRFAGYGIYRDGFVVVNHGFPLWWNIAAGTWELIPANSWVIKLSRGLCTMVEDDYFQEAYEVIT